MSNDNDNDDYLSPHGLLGDDDFCLKVPSFHNLQVSIQDTENLPTSDDAFCQKTGFWETGYQILYSYLYPIIDKCQTIQQVAANLSYDYRSIGDVCDKLSDLCASAPDDYDKIFNDLEQLRQDPNDSTLREKVQKEVQDRLNLAHSLCCKSVDLHEMLSSNTTKAIDIQADLHQLAVPLGNPDIRDELQNNDSADNLQDDLDALDRSKKMLDDLQTKIQSGDSLQQLEKFLGSVNVIVDDLQDLIDYIEQHTDPDDNPLGGLVEKKLLQKWAELKNYVKQFEDKYMDGGP